MYIKKMFASSSDMPDNIGEVTENVISSFISNSQQMKTGYDFFVSGIEIHFLYPSLKIGISRLSSKC
jgi:hypothetical protein